MLMVVLVVIAGDVVAGDVVDVVVVDVVVVDVVVVVVVVVIGTKFRSHVTFVDTRLLVEYFME